MVTIFIFIIDCGLLDLKFANFIPQSYPINTGEALSFMSPHFYAFMNY